jgi:hypothetical protein
MYTPGEDIYGSREHQAFRETPMLASDTRSSVELLSLSGLWACAGKSACLAVL